MSWLYNILGVRSLAATLGTVEIIAAVLIALRLVSPRLSALGSAEDPALADDGRILRLAED